MKFQRTSSQPDTIVLLPSAMDISTSARDNNDTDRHFSAPGFWQQVLTRTVTLLGQVPRALRIRCSSEPVIRQKRDRQGQFYYTIYDPMTGDRTSHASEHEVRVWLEQRYYQ